MLEFTAIDFETANKYANSACSLAAVQMRGTQCIQEQYSLIKPPFMTFDPKHITIHGITPEQVRQEKNFLQLWPLFKPCMEKKILAAHYAVFDTRVLRSTLKTYHLDVPAATYVCTVQIFRKVWPQLPNHKLDTVANMLGYSFHHHHALEDAGACAYILCAAACTVGADSVEELMRILALPIHTL